MANSKPYVKMYLIDEDEFLNLQDVKYAQRHYDDIAIDDDGGSTPGGGGSTPGGDDDDDDDDDYGGGSTPGGSIHHSIPKFASTPSRRPFTPPGSPASQSHYSNPPTSPTQHMET